jgi:UDP-N-acetylglucosamine:LPS N-acetylglucosamine transferase
LLRDAKLYEIGAAKMLLEPEMKGEALANAIRELYTDETARAEMQRNSRSVGRPDACAKVVDVAMSLIKQSFASSPVGQQSKRHHSV